MDDCVHFRFIFMRSRFLTSTKTPPIVTEIFRDFLPFFEKKSGYENGCKNQETGKQICVAYTSFC